MKLWLKTLLMIGAIILLTAGAVGIYATTVLNSTTKAFQTTYTDVGNSDTQKVLKATKPLTILIMGVDTGGIGRGTADSWNGNSDSQILMTLNPATQTTTMMSVERDTMTNILDGNGNVVGRPQKMNAAYPMGYNAGDSSGKGLETAVSYAMSTIGNQTGISIDNFITINFDGVINLVNDVGGIDVDNTTGRTMYIYNTEPQYTATVPPGKQHINGEQALVYARDRDHAPGGDYGRSAHQREIIAALVKKLLALDNITQYQKFMNEAANDFKTNIPINGSTITSLLGYKDCFNKVVSIQARGVGNMLNGVSYEFYPTDVYLAFQNAMRRSLGEPTQTTLSTNLIPYEKYFGSSTSYYLPSATVTEGGKQTVYGVNPDGSFVTLTADNAGKYVSANTGVGLTAQDNSTTTTESGSSASSSSSMTTQSSSSSASSTTSSSTTSSGLPAGLTKNASGQLMDVGGYYVYYRNGSYVYYDGTPYTGGTLK